MPFGSGVRGERLASVLKIRADTGQAKQEITELGQQVEHVMQGMTAEQLRLDRATKHFQQTLERFGPTHERTKTAALRLDAAQKALARSTDQAGRSVRRATHDYDNANRSLGTLTRGALAGSGLFRSLGRQIAFASGGFIGATGFVAAVKAAVGASSDLNEQVSQSRYVFGRLSPEVEKFARQSLGLTTTEALRSAGAFGSLLQNMGLTRREAATQSEYLTQLAVDLASFKNTSVEDSLQAITSGLVGQVEPLRRYAIEVSAARVQQVALAMTGKATATELTRQEKAVARLAIIYGDSRIAQGDFARTGGQLANQQRELRRNVINEAAAIGDELLPAVLDATKRLNHWLENTENQKKLQHDVNKIVEYGGKAFDIISGAMRGANAILGPLVDLLGGFENAATLAFGATMLGKIRRFAGSFSWIGASAKTAATTVTTQAAVIEAELDAATRPRNIVVTTVVDGVPMGRGRRFLGKLGRGAAAGAGAYILYQGFNAFDSSGDQGQPQQPSVGTNAKNAGLGVGGGAVAGFTVAGPPGAIVGATAGLFMAGNDPGASRPGWPERAREFLNKLEANTKDLDRRREAFKKHWDDIFRYLDPAGQEHAVRDVLGYKKATGLSAAGEVLYGSIPGMGASTATAAGRPWEAPNPAEFILPGGKKLSDFVRETDGTAPNAPGQTTDFPKAPGASKAAKAAKERRAMVKKLQEREKELELKAIHAQADDTLKNDIEIAKERVKVLAAIKELQKNDFESRKDYENALLDVWQLEDQQRSKVASDKAEKKAAAREAHRVAAEGYAAARIEIQAQIDQATNLNELRVAQKRMNDLLSKASHDMILTARERARYAAAIGKGNAAIVKATRKVRESLLLRDVAAAADTEHTLRDDIAAEQALLRTYKQWAAAKDQSLAQQQAWQAKADATEKKIRRLRGQRTTRVHAGFQSGLGKREADLLDSEVQAEGAGNLSKAIKIQKQVVRTYREFAHLAEETASEKLLWRRREREAQRKLSRLEHEREDRAFELTELTLQNKVQAAALRGDESAEIKFERALVARYKKMAARKKNTKLETQQWLQRALQEEAALQTLLKKDADPKRRSLGWDFLDKQAGFFSSFAPNTLTNLAGGRRAPGSSANPLSQPQAPSSPATPGSSPHASNGPTDRAPTNVTVNQIFNSLPANTRRQATMAKHGFVAAFG
jgi:hypothetical protein